ncbi:MAG TPA: hypothetical protein VEY94_02615, partial [Patescibacteria group bacterium]|nr:hypothetical protein [Patescibacteria group bacterium]
LIQPVVVHNGQLVDGRNRALACKAARVELRTVEWRDVYQGDEPLSRWIWSINAERRHLTIDQYLAAQVALTGYEEREEARLKQVAAGKEQAAHGSEGGRGHKKPLMTKSSEGVTKPKPAPTTRKKLAQQYNVSEHKAQQVLNVDKKKHELLKEIAQGKMPLREAAKRVAKPKQQPIQKEWDFSEASERLHNAANKELKVAPPRDHDSIAYLLRAIATEIDHGKGAGRAPTG